eukprot:2997656-Amphidinium_carterae.1
MQLLGQHSTLKPLTSKERPKQRLEPVPRSPTSTTRRLTLNNFEVLTVYFMAINVNDFDFLNHTFGP